MTRNPEASPACPPSAGRGSAALEDTRAAAPGTVSPRPDGARSTSSSLPALAPTGAGSGPAPGARRRAGSPADTAGTAERTDAAVLAAPQWTIELPAGLKLLSLNDRIHHMERHRRSEAIKKAAWAMTLKAKPPHLERVTVTIVYDPPNLSRDRDPDNLGPTLKPVIDGITLAGKIGRHVPGRRGSGDDARYVVHAGCEIGDQPYPRGRLRVIIREVTA